MALRIYTLLVPLLLGPRRDNACLRIHLCTRGNISPSPAFAVSKSFRGTLCIYLLDAYPVSSPPCLPYCFEQSQLHLSSKGLARWRCRFCGRRRTKVRFMLEAQVPLVAWAYYFIILRTLQNRNQNLLLILIAGFHFNKNPIYTKVIFNSPSKCFACMCINTSTDR